MVGVLLLGAIVIVKGFKVGGFVVVVNVLSFLAILVSTSASFVTFVMFEVVKFASRETAGWCGWWWLMPVVEDCCVTTVVVPGFVSGVCDFGL